MTDVVIQVRDNGPLMIQGPVQVLDGGGQEFPRDAAKPAIFLCRCGHSANKPFCDGAHKASGFQAAERGRE
jgi:CDGSH-type Zn-finger protein